MSAAYILVLFLQDFIMEPNNMNLNQTAPKEQSDQGPYCSQYKLSKNIRIWESRQHNSWVAGKRVNILECSIRVIKNAPGNTLIGTFALYKVCAINSIQLE